MAVLLLAPFVVYYLLFRTTDFTIIIGILLVGVAIYAVVQFVSAKGWIITV